ELLSYFAILALGTAEWGIRGRVIVRDSTIGGLGDIWHDGADSLEGLADSQLRDQVRQVILFRNRSVVGHGVLKACDEDLMLVANAIDKFKNGICHNIPSARAALAFFESKLRYTIDDCVSTLIRDCMI